MRHFARRNGLSLAFGALFLAALGGQALVGHANANHQQAAHQAEAISLARYLSSSAFWADVMENWQSEYLQFTLFILATVWLGQRGSTESKPEEKLGGESDEEQKIGRYASADSPAWAKAGGLKTWIYGNSLLAVMLAIWLASWAAQAITGRIVYNAEQFDHQEASLTLWQYVGTSDFWNRTLQNWQSEFLAVGSVAVLSIYLRQRGSAQSKPVGEPHASTGAAG